MANRNYLVGETVTLKVAVNRPGTREPVDPDEVELSTLKRAGQTVTVTPTDFTNLSVGEYELVIETSDLQAGVYDFVVTVAGSAGVVLLPDRFTLKAP